MEQFVYRQVKINGSISIYKLWVDDNVYYWCGNKPYYPVNTTEESIKTNYMLMGDAFNHPVLTEHDVKHISQHVQKYTYVKPVNDWA
jgi:hypothetical protein